MTTGRTPAPGPEDPYGREADERRGRDSHRSAPMVPDAETPGAGRAGSDPYGQGPAGAAGTPSAAPGMSGSEAGVGTSRMRGPEAGEAPPEPDVRATMGGETAEGRDALGARGGTEHAQGGIEDPHAPLLPADESDRLTTRLQHAIAEFVDRPREAVEEADHVLEELTTRFTDAMSDRRRALRGHWQPTDGGGDRAEEMAGNEAGTEELRLALRDYRELTNRLLHI
ncbi:MULTISPECIES: hypothetical protein [unclassified Streptomyces]|uniref:hypothetical protein n=1 Tax=unclassified Streptomyces TaxID=2593676 RepID=UPI003D739A18